MSSSEEKTLKPSEKKLRDSRKKGQVAQYQDLMSLTGLAVGLIYLWWTLTSWVDFSTAALDLSFQQIAETGPEAYQSVIDLAIDEVVPLIMGVMGLLIATAILTSIIVQRGLVFSFEPITPKFDNLNPVSGFKKIFGVRPLVELAKNLIRLTLGLFVVWLVIRFSINSLVQAPNCGASCLIISTVGILAFLFLALLFLALLFAVPDILIQKWLFERDQKMSVSEQKRENKDVHGNPEIRSAQRRLRAEVADMRTKMGIRNASLVIYGEDHAIGLRYVKEEVPVPMVVARATGKAAVDRLMAGAKLHVVPHYHEPDLARTLTKMAKGGQPAPKEEYTRIAEAFNEAGLNG